MIWMYETWADIRRPGSLIWVLSLYLIKYLIAKLLIKAYKGVVEKTYRQTHEIKKNIYSFFFFL